MAKAMKASSSQKNGHVEYESAKAELERINKEFIKVINDYKNNDCCPPKLVNGEVSLADDDAYASRAFERHAKLSHGLASLMQQACHVLAHQNDPNAYSNITDG